MTYKEYRELLDQNAKERRQIHEDYADYIAQEIENKGINVGDTVSKIMPAGIIGITGIYLGVFVKQGRVVIDVAKITKTGKAHKTATIWGFELGNIKKA